MTVFEVHELALAFPPLRELDPDAYQTMVDDMRANGYVGQPITLYENKVLEGRSRYEAWQEAGGNGDIPSVRYKGPVELLARYVYNANAQRRHLHGLQKAVIYLRMFLTDVGDPMMTAEQLSKISGVRPHTAATALTLYRFCGDDVLEQCASGSMSLADAEEIAASHSTVLAKAESEEKQNINEFYVMVRTVGDGAIYTRNMLIKALKISDNCVPWFVRCCDLSPRVQVIRTFGKRQLRQYTFKLTEE